MSNGRNICVCGRERGNGAVIISITTCKHNNSSNGAGSVCISAPPKTTDKKSTPSRKVTYYDKPTPLVSPSEEPQDETPSESIADNVDKAVQEPENEQPQNKLDEPTEEPVEDITNEQPQIEADEPTEEPDEDETNVQPQNKTDEPTEEPDEDETNENTNEVPIMMLRETAVNTMPFLQNLFRFRQGYGTKSSFDKEDENSDCTVEIFIFEKHVKDCGRIKRIRILNENSFHDGDSWVESIGRISFPTCTDAFRSNKPSRVNLASGSHSRSESERNINHYKRVLKMLEAYLRNRQYYESLNNKGPFDIQLQKYITMSNDLDNKESSKSIVNELYISKVKNDKSVQFSGLHTDGKERDEIRPTKWYEGFLICFGIRQRKDVHDIENLDHQLRRESSFLMTRYLRI